MHLSSLKGQDRVLSYLGAMINRDRLHHALLFVGQDGVGKRTAAKALANRLVCASPKDLDACGQCGHCIRFREGTHADYLVVERGTKSDGSLEKMIKVDQIRNIQRSLSLKSFEGGQRVVVIFDADRMNSSTANALLKTLEEPPESVSFILTSNSLSSLLPTIISRCQMIRFAPLSIESLTKIGNALGEIGEVDRVSAIAQANGSASRLHRLLNPEVDAFRLECRERIGSLSAHGSAADVLEFAEKDASDKQRVVPYLVLDFLQHWYRSALVSRYSLESKEDLVTRTTAPQHQLMNFLGLIDRIREELNTNQRNTRIAMEEVWFEVARLEMNS